MLRKSSLAASQNFVAPAASEWGVSELEDVGENEHDEDELADKAGVGKDMTVMIKAVFTVTVLFKPVRLVTRATRRS